MDGWEKDSKGSDDGECNDESDGVENKVHLWGPVKKCLVALALIFYILLQYNKVIYGINLSFELF